MNIVVKGGFDRDTDNIGDKELRSALKNKILQIERAKDLRKLQGLNY